jgi:6-phosphogluconolactonase
MTKPEIIISPIDTNWPSLAAVTIRQAIDKTIASKGRCTLMLAGGKTVEPVYSSWATQRDFPHDQITYFFGDERCVTPDHPDSNYGQAMRFLFPDGAPPLLSCHRIKAEEPDKDAASRSYEDILPDAVDIVLLGMGEDGHIASLFPGDQALLETTRRVLPVIGPKQPKQRLTITPPVISKADLVFLLATGSVKGEVLARALKEPRNIKIMPVQLLLNAVWILDYEAAIQLPDSGR